MARLPRLVVPQQPHHIVQRGNDRQPIFRDHDDYFAFLNWLRAGARQFKVALHAYGLMTNQIHLLASPMDATGLAKMMQWIGRYYVPYFNRKYQRTGTLWEGRFKATVIDNEPYFLVCSRYIEFNPVRAGMVADAAEYPWSSYAHHIGLKPDPFMTDHPLFWALGNTPFQREAAYRALAEQALTDEQIDKISKATERGGALGSAEFMAGLTKQLARRVQPGRRGRPPKQAKSVAASTSLPAADSVPNNQNPRGRGENK